MQKTGSLLHDSFSSYSQFKIRCFRGRKPKVDLPAHTKSMITFVQLNYICWNFGKRQLIKFTYHLYATDFEILRFCIFPCHLFSKNKISKKKKSHSKVVDKTRKYQDYWFLLHFSDTLCPRQKRSQISSSFAF